MGRSGHLQTRQAEHKGASLTGYCSQHAADFLEEGVRAARLHDYNWIVVDWWD